SRPRPPPAPASWSEQPTKARVSGTSCRSTEERTRASSQELALFLGRPCHLVFSSPLGAGFLAGVGLSRSLLIPLSLLLPHPTRRQVSSRRKRPSRVRPGIGASSQRNNGKSRPP